MARVSFFIDGFNLYHALDNDGLRHFKWLNLRKMAESYLRKQDSISDVFYGNMDHRQRGAEGRPLYLEKGQL